MNRGDDGGLTIADFRLRIEKSTTETPRHRGILLLSGGAAFGGKTIQIGRGDLQGIEHEGRVLARQVGINDEIEDFVNGELKAGAVLDDGKSEIVAESQVVEAAVAAMTASRLEARIAVDQQVLAARGGVGVANAAGFGRHGGDPLLGVANGIKELGTGSRGSRGNRFIGTSRTLVISDL